MKIVLSLNEVGEILVDHLRKTGKLENVETDLHWHVSKNNLKDSYVEIKQ